MNRENKEKKRLAMRLAALLIGLFPAVCAKEETSKNRINDVTFHISERLNEVIDLMISQRSSSFHGGSIFTTFEQA